MREHERPIKAQGEIALRVSDLATMQRFYEEVVGLELMRRTDSVGFFKGNDSPRSDKPALKLCAFRARIFGFASKGFVERRHRRHIRTASL
jgi:catechol 2,3-dioxygenase-like lactoylglutathione lyase family enzyme